MFLFTSYISLSRELSWMLLPVAWDPFIFFAVVYVFPWLFALWNDFPVVSLSVTNSFRWRFHREPHYHQYASRIISHIYFSNKLTTIPKASDDIT
jgi:hypothetical protein